VPNPPVSLTKPSDADARISGEAVVHERLAYRLLTGAGDRAFCERISEALREGYELYGDPAVTWNGHEVVSAQAVILPGTPR
jgi:hypothetical protein